MNDRLNLIKNWLESELKIPEYNINKLTGDASFRQYFRINLPDVSYILMDAPPGRECCKTFANLDHFFRENHIHVPKIYAENITDGFLLLEDFGDDVLLSILTPGNADNYYHKAIDIICDIQAAKTNNMTLPPFDKKFMLEEMELFREWLLKNLLQYPLSSQEDKIITAVFNDLADKIALQHYAVTHRDFHSRNLMRLPNDELGVLDFQDAVMGPYVYDLVSLLKDAYITWSRDKTELWLSYFYDTARNRGLILDINLESLFMDFEITGLQRHIKVAGIFARLYKRDGKEAYLKDIPRVLHYINVALARIECYHDFYQLLIEKWMPQVEMATWSK